MKESDPEECGERDHHGARYPPPGRGPGGGRTPSPFDVRPIAGIVRVAAPPILHSAFAVFVERTTCAPFIDRYFRPARTLRILGENVNAAELVEKLVPHRRRS